MPAKRAEAETSKHWGRAYQCLRCFRDNKEVIAEKYRLEDHIRKCHLSLDQLPYYCSLCLFRCTEKSQLEDHVAKYRWHAQILKEKGVADSPSYLKENPNPYIIGKDDYIKLSQEESSSYFNMRAQMKRSASDTQDLLSQAVQELEPLDPVSSLSLTPDLGSPTLPILQTPGPAQTSTGGSNITEMWNLFNSFMVQVQKNQATTPCQASSITTPPPRIDLGQCTTSSVPYSTATVTSQACTTMAPICSPALQPTTAHGLRPQSKAPSATVTVQDISGPDEYPLDLSSCASYQTQPLNLQTISKESSSSSEIREFRNVDSGLLHTGPPQEARTLNPVSKGTADPAKETTDAGINKASQGQVEDIMPQLLGQDSPCIATPQEETALNTSPRNSDTRIIQMRESTTRPPTIQILLEDLRCSVEKGNKMVKEEVEKNSRAVRCLEKAIREQTEATLEQTQIMKDMKASVNNFISYYRTCAREERRREEERSEREEKRRWPDKEEDFQPKRRRGTSPNRNPSPRIKSILGKAPVSNKENKKNKFN